MLHPHNFDIGDVTFTLICRGDERGCQQKGVFYLGVQIVFGRMHSKGNKITYMPSSVSSPWSSGMSLDASDGGSAAMSARVSFSTVERLRAAVRNIDIT